MFSKKKTISSVESYLFGRNTIFKKQGSLFQLINAFQEEELLPKVSDYFLRGDLLFYQKGNLEDVFVLDLITEEQNKIVGAYSIGSSMVFGKDGFFLIGESGGIKSLYEIDYSYNIKRSVSYTFPLMILATKEGLVFKKRGNLSVVDIKNNKQLWSYEIPPPSKIQSIKQIEELLIVQSKTNELYGLDSQTGEKVWELPDVSYHHTYDFETGLLYSFGGEIYRVIDPNKGKVIIEKQFERIEEKYRVSPQGHMNSISGGYLYFMSNWYNPRFGAIDITTHEIDFIQRLEVEEGVKGGIPNYHDNKLFIKDSLDTLHIFERTD